MEIVTNIRAGNRATLTNTRNIKRTLELDRRRLIDQSEHPSLNVQEVANKLKTKLAVSSEELSLLKNALLTESKINEFMKVHGALRGLVREFTGLDSKKQMSAVDCLCNLALGDARSSQIIAKSVGSYLLPCLHSLNTELVVTSVWTLGNLAGSHERVCNILIAQGALTTLTSLLAETTVDEIEEAVFYALVHFVYNIKDGLSHDSSVALIEIVRTRRKYKSSYQLLYLLSCHPIFLQVTSSDYVFSLLEDFASQNLMDNGEADTSRLIYLVRTLANICADNNFSDFVLQSVINTRKQLNQFETVLLIKCNKLRRSVLWLLGNIFNSCTKNHDNGLFFQTFSHNIML